MCYLGMATGQVPLAGVSHERLPSLGSGLCKCGCCTCCGEDRLEDRVEGNNCLRLLMTCEHAYSTYAAVQTLNSISC